MEDNTKEKEILAIIQRKKDCSFWQRINYVMGKARGGDLYGEFSWKTETLKVHCRIGIISQIWSVGYTQLAAISVGEDRQIPVQGGNPRTPTAVFKRGRRLDYAGICLAGLQLQRTASSELGPVQSKGPIHIRCLRC
jgi:hypothetical protein